MRGYNKITLMGNLARDPEVRYGNGGTATARFAVAVNRVWKDKSGETKEEVDYLPVTVWGSMAENCERYLSKGSPVFVEGRIQIRKYEAKDGSTKWSTDVVASQVIFLGNGKKDDSSEPPSRTRSEKSSGGFPKAEDEEFDPHAPDEDIPF